MKPAFELSIKHDWVVKKEGKEENVRDSIPPADKNLTNK